MNVVLVRIPHANFNLQHLKSYILRVKIHIGNQEVKIQFLSPLDFI